VQSNWFLKKFHGSYIKKKSWKLRRIPPDLSMHFPFQEALSESVPHLVPVLH
jgi:hypothetical protein